MLTKPKRNVSLVLLDVRSVHNVGAIFRTADAAGINLIYLVGTTPTPLDRFGRSREDMHKAALGAESFVLWKHELNINQLIEKLKKQNTEIIAIEQSSESIDYKKYKIPKDKKIAFIVGTEVTGVPKLILNKCDKVLEIPMRGEKESLNITTALGIALFRVLNI
jgi:23S rRNA (guanosine2251-2'-O)-methyltransferase